MDVIIFDNAMNNKNEVVSRKKKHNSIDATNCKSLTVLREFKTQSISLRN